MTLLTPEVRALIGSELVYVAPEEFGRASFRYFALAIGDDNPLYTDEDFSRRHGHPDVIAPPTLICETNQYSNLRRADDGYAGHAWPLDLPNTRMVRGGNTYVFHQPLLPTDVVTAVWRLTEAVERISSSGSEMLIVTSVAEFTNQNGEPLATNTETMIFTALEPS